MGVFKCEKKVKYNVRLVVDVFLRVTALDSPSDLLALNSLKLLGAMLAHVPEAILLRSPTAMTDLIAKIDALKKHSNEQVRSLAAQLATSVFANIK